MDERQLIASTPNRAWKRYLILVLVVFALWVTYSQVICVKIKDSYTINVDTSLSALQASDPSEYLKTMREKVLKEHQWKELEPVLNKIGYIFPVMLLCVVLFFFGRNSYQLVVTNRQIYGRMAFGRRVEIPLDVILGASTTKDKKGITVFTVVNKYRFLQIENATEIQNVIHGLIAENG